MGESLDIDQLRAAARQERLEWQRHALERMVERGITRAEVREVLLGGERIEDYPGDRPLPSGLFLSWARGRPLHVVDAFDMANRTVAIITTYEPTLEYFEADFRTRRKS
jgi:Domain of unknown function (DUF4258)